ncbi:hypothetical protein SAMN04244559_02977 [Magnetospirillum fulvum]|uniref:Cellulase-like protein n=2 Tax=Magnetospirillum fulvum TaxID=1082 RepID=A0A1H6J871_MAGFU|nr:hypothetical protein SAMN04244559_02977 [Magnetospirillum fulvum]
MRPNMAVFALALLAAPLSGLAQSAPPGAYPDPMTSAPVLRPPLQPPAPVAAPVPVLPPPPLHLGADLSFPVAVLQGLDKVSARVLTIEAPVGTPVRFGSLEIIARACKKRPPEDLPESAAFLDIWELRPGEPTAELFRGWMFASSPALSAMEHPVYDIWVLDCKGAPGR